MKRMKQKLFVGSLALLAFMASCSSSNDDLTGGAPSPKESSVPITFGSYLGRTATSRAGATGVQTTSTLATNGFGLFATYTDNATYTADKGPNFMYNTKVSTKDWTYSPLRYWPNETSTTNADGKGATSEGVDRLSFFAYAPYVEATASTGAVTDNTEGITALTANNATTDPKVTYVVAATPEKSVDLLWGVVPTGTTTWSNVSGTNVDLTEGLPYLNLIKPNTTQKVNFNFRHALAKLGLKVVGAFDAVTGGKKEEADTKITVASVTIEGTGFKKTAVLNLNNTTANEPLWEDVKDAGDITLTVSGDNLNSKIKDSGKDEAQTVAGVTETAQDLLNSDATSAQKAFMIIPSSAADKSLKVTIDYYVNTTDASLSKGHSRVENKITKTITGFAPEAGKNYTLLLSLGMTSVKVTATVANWDNGTDTQVNLPINVE
jgi:hypothetical protein